jgi:hypothetical protein
MVIQAQQTPGPRNAICTEAKCSPNSLSGNGKYDLSCQQLLQRAKSSAPLIFPSCAHQNYPFNNQNAAATQKRVHFDERSKQMCFFSPADAPLFLKSNLPSTAIGVTSLASICDPSSKFGYETPWTTSSKSSAPSTPHLIRLKTLELSPSYDQIRGMIDVANVFSQKEVLMRFTSDNWKTWSEVTAQHYLSDYLGQSIIYDLFTFTIEKENLLFESDVSIQLYAFYKVIGQEFLDNNDWYNYYVALAT